MTDSDEYTWGAGKHNYWRGKYYSNGEFVINIGCTTLISEIVIRNCRDWNKHAGTKQFSIYLSMRPTGPWKKVLTRTLDDPTYTDPKDIPKQIFRLDEMPEWANYIKFKSESYYNMAPSLMFIDIHTNYMDEVYYATPVLKEANCDHYSYEKVPNRFKPNYWLTDQHHRGYAFGNYMLVDLGCNVLVNGFEVKNSHNSIKNDFSTKQIKVRLQHWKYSTVWKKLIDREMPDSRGEVSTTVQVIKTSTILPQSSLI